MGLGHIEDRFHGIGVADQGKKKGLKWQYVPNPGKAQDHPTPGALPHRCSDRHSS